MEQSLEQRMASRIPWQSSDPSAVLRTGERAALTVHRRGGSTSALIQAGLEQNPPAALLLNRLLLRRNLLDTDLTTAIADACRRELAAAETADTADPVTLAPLCAALVILQLRPEAVRALSLCGRSMPQYTEGGQEFSRRLLQFLNAENSQPLILQAELLNLMYQCLSLDWNEQLLYHYGVELPTGGQIPPALIELVQRAEQDCAFRYLHNLFTVFVDLRPADVGLSPEPLTERAFGIESIEIFRALLFCHKVFKLESPSELEGLDRWWAVLQRHQEDANPFWQQHRGWFTLYYVSRQARFEPARVAELLNQYPTLPPPPPGKPYQKTSRVIQNAITDLFFTPGDVLLRYLQWCCDYNPFRYRSDEERTPYSYLNRQLNLDAAFRFQRSQGRTARELVYLYMNSFARCQFALHHLGRILCEYPEMHPNQYGTITVENLFEDYPIPAILQGQNVSWSVRPLNVRTGESGFLTIPPDWVSARQAHFNAAGLDGTRVRCVVFRLSAANGSAYVKPLFDNTQAEAARQVRREAFDEFCLRLQQIADTGRFDPLINREIQQLGISPLLPPYKMVRMERLVVACCASLLATPGQARHFVLMLSNLHRGRLNRYRFPCQNSRHRMSTYLDKQLFSDCRKLWQTIRTLRPAWDELFFVYINTPFKMCVSMGELVRLYAPPGNAPMDLREQYSHPHPHWFAGTITGRLPANRSPLGQDCLILHPLEFSPGAPNHRDRFLYPISGPADELPPSDRLYAFRISKLLLRDHCFVLEELALADDRRRISPKAVYMEAMGQAACTAAPPEQVRRDLGLFSGPLTWEDRTELITMTLQALSLRADSASALEQFLADLGPNNPWPTAQDTGLDEWVADLSHSAPLNELTRLLALHQELETSLRIYFSSVLRAVLPLNRLLGASARAGRSLLLVPKQMESHLLTLHFDPDGPQTRGFRIGDWELDGTAPAAGSLTVRVTGYIPETDRLILRPVGE